MGNEMVKVFETAELGSVRVVVIDDEPWFVGKDVTDCLGYGNTAAAVGKHVDSEDKTTITICDGGSNYKTRAFIINESGLYSLIMRSKLPSSKAFKRWVTSEVCCPQ